MTVEEFNEVFRSLYPQLSFFAFRFLKDRYLAEDMVQDSFLALFINIGRTDYSKARAFLFVMVVNKCKNAYRHSIVVQNVNRDIAYSNKCIENVVLDNLIHSELVALVMKEIELLTPMRKRVFKLSWLYGIPNPEIAKLLGISIHTVKEHKGVVLKYMRGHFANLKTSDND